ncbi:Hypothetical protein A7982_06612 [Minicystis rosea]|nr:Hypothetical protein A7982_06612 [Minicystis rosea]
MPFVMHRNIAPRLWLLAAVLLSGCDAAEEENDYASLGEVCTEARACGPDLFCAQEYHWCSGPAEYRSSQCASRSIACDDVHPVCGCDDEVYANTCAAHAAGVDIGGASAGNEHCPHELTPAGMFACGPYFCDAVSEYCDYGEGDTYDRDTECRPLPDTCPVASCDCFPEDFTHVCKAVPGNGVTGFVHIEIWQ